MIIFDCDFTFNRSMLYNKSCHLMFFLLLIFLNLVIFIFFLLILFNILRIIFSYFIFNFNFIFYFIVQLTIVLKESYLFLIILELAELNFCSDLFNYFMQTSSMELLFMDEKAKHFYVLKNSLLIISLFNLFGLFNFFLVEFIST